MADALSNLEGNSHPIIYNSPCTLAALASIKIAFSSWLKTFAKLPSVRFTEGPDDDQPSQRESQLDAMDYIPHAMRTKVDFCMDLVLVRIRQWCRTNNREYFHNRLNLLVFSGRGVIHWKDSISNFLADDSLQNMVKFKLACLGCAEQTIDLLWPLVRDEFNIHNLQFDSGDFLLYYWICRKIGWLGRIPLWGYSRLELVMIDKCSKNCYCLAVEYFVKLWDPNNRFVEIDQFSANSQGSAMCYAFVLPYLDVTLQRYILDKYGALIFDAFLEHSDLYEYAVQTWVYIRNSFTAERFISSILSRFLSKLACCGRRDWYKRVIEEVFVEIWFSSPLEWRKYAQTFYSVDILNFCYLNGIDVFSLAFLSDLDFDARNRIWTENWSKWLKRMPTAQFFKLMTLHLVENEVDDFKTTLLNSEVFQKYYKRLMRLGHCSKLDDFLNYLYPDRARVFTIKKDMLANGLKMFLVRGRSRQLKKHMRHIDKTFTNADLADDFKSEVIFSDEVWKMMSDKIDYGDFDTVQAVVCSFTTMRRCREIKGKLLPMVSEESGRVGSVLFRYLWRRVINGSWPGNGRDRRINCGVRYYMLQVKMIYYVSSLFIILNIFYILY